MKIYTYTADQLLAPIPPLSLVSWVYNQRVNRTEPDNCIRRVFSAKNIDIDQALLEHIKYIKNFILDF